VPISENLANRAIAEISKGRANYEYFFDRLSSPEWIAPLRDRGLFSDPPPLEIADGRIQAPPWPPSRFLARVASQAPEEVLEIMLDIETNNERVHEDFAEAAAAMPIALAKKWCEHETRWLRKSETLYFGLPEKLTDLAETLPPAGETEVAAILVETLFRPVLGGDERGSDAIRALFFLWNYRNLLERAVQPIVRSAPKTGLRLLVRLLSTATTMTSSVARDWGDDYSQVWRPRVSVDDVDIDIRQAIVSVLRNAVVEVRKDSILTDAELTTILAEGGTRVFRRISAFALSQPPEPDTDALADILVDSVAFFSAEPSTEYRELLAERFGNLPSAARETIYSWLSQGPDLVEFRASAEARGEKVSESNVELYAARWLIRRLDLLRKHLSEYWSGRLRSLVDQYGPSQFVTSFEFTAWWGPTSPLQLADLQQLPDDDLVELLSSYEPSDRFFGPSPGGLARTLSDLAEAEPERLSKLISRLLELRPIYLQWTLIGLQKAIREDKPVNWEAMLQPLLSVGTVPPDDEGSGRDEENIGRWTWVRKEVAGILEAGLRAAGSTIPFALRESAWHILEVLVEDPEPSNEYEIRFGGSNMDPAMLALNTTRGRAMHAVVSYALWVRRQLDDTDAPGPGFGAMPEVRSVLNRHLQVEYDPSVAVRSVYGQRLPWLALLDEAWVTQSVSQIFPSDATLAQLRDAAWHSYMIYCQPFNAMARVLRNQYSSAVDQLNAGELWGWREGAQKVDQRLGAHLLTFYWRGLFKLNNADTILRRFFEHAAADTRSYAIEFVGRALRETPTLARQVRKRLQRLWEWRIAEVEKSTDEGGKREIASFGWWADANCLPADWRLTQLDGVLRLEGTLEEEPITLDALVKLASHDPQRTIDILQRLLASMKEGWTIVGNQHSIEEVLRVCLASDDAEASALAESVIHWLGSAGHRTFRDLLRREPSSG
jgi:hypothetical protein